MNAEALAVFYTDELLATHQGLTFLQDPFHYEDVETWKTFTNNTSDKLTCAAATAFLSQKSLVTKGNVNVCVCVCV